MNRRAPRFPVFPALALLLLALLTGCGDTGDDDDGVGDDDDDTAPVSDVDQDGWTYEAGDCNDFDAEVYPGAQELCDGKDNDCNGEPDDVPDIDGDGFTVCAGDCDDVDPLRHPGLADGCDGVDDDCDGGIDEDGRLSTWYADRDGDGFGNPAALTFSCPAPSGFVADASDCDDSAAAVNPASLEVCGDEIDNDCDGTSTVCSRRIPGSLAYADATLSGAHAAERAGYSVNSLLDMNGDGFDDFVVSAPGDDTGGPDAGAVSVFFGPVRGALPLEAADARILSEGAGDQAGHAVASAGDVNGDGTPDLLIGVPYADAGGTDAGAAYLFHGPLEGDLTLADADAVLVGEGAGAMTGWSVSAGDVDGDGRADLVVGAPSESSAAPEAGAVYVVYGPVSGTVELGDLGDAGAKLTGGGRADRAGYSVNSIRDMNWDGKADLLIGAPYEDTGGEDAGAVYVVHGPVTGTSSLASAAAVRYGARPADRAGYSVNSILGEAPGGLPSLVVGAPFEDSGGADAGAVYVVHGPLSGAGSLEAADAKLTGGRAADRAGYSVNSLRDEDGDGVSDLVVGAPFEDTGGTDAGAVYVVRGPLTGDLSLEEADVKLVGAGAGHNAGFAVASAGDVDGGGLSDLLVGAPGQSSPDSFAGAAYLVLGPANGRLYLDLSSNAGRFSGGEPGRTGASVAPLGDVDGDGFGDLLIGAPDDTTGGAGAGAAFLVRGGADLEASLEASAVIMGAPADGAGFAVAGAGDLDGDGRGDLLVGAPYRDGEAANGGGVGVFFGPVSGTLELAGADGLIVSEAAGALAGWSVAGVGDVNGDGKDDVLVGVPNDGWSGPGAGAAYLFHGPVTGTRTLSSAEAKFFGEAAGDSAGWSVAAAGDVNGDGRPDLLVGAPYHAGTAGAVGVVYLVTGPFSGNLELKKAKARLEGGPGSVIGLAVSGAGDVNGDGYADLLIGAPQDSGGGAGAGAAFLVYGPVSGRVDLDAVAVKLEGAAHDRAGTAVSGAGDVNGDGYADLFIGAPGHAGNGDDAGAAYLLFGPLSGARALASADLELGGAPGSEAGSALAPAGDVDEDGLIDLLIGAPGWTDAAEAKGAAWLLSGSR